MSKTQNAGDSRASRADKSNSTNNHTNRYIQKQNFLKSLDSLSPKQREAAFKKKNPSLYREYRTGTRLLMCSDASGHGGIAVCAYLTGSKEFTFYVKKVGKSREVSDLELEGLRMSWRAMSNYKFDRCAMFCDNADAVQTASAANNHPNISIAWTKGHTKFSSVQSKLNRLADSAASLQRKHTKARVLKNLLYPKVKTEFPWVERENVKVIKVD